METKPNVSPLSEKLIPFADTGRPDHLIGASFVSPATINLTFADGAFALAIELLEMPLDRIRWETARASPNGDALVVQALKGESIPIDSSTLRYLVDPVYAAAIDKSLNGVKLTREELADATDQSIPPPEWFTQPERDLRLDSWK